MARTKGAINKKITVEETITEVKEPKRRGRQKGDKITKEPAVYIGIDEKNRIKIDKWNYTWQQKGKEENTEINDEIETVEAEDNEDKGWKMMGHYAPKPESVEYICKLLRDNLALQKTKKEKNKIVPIERYIELLNKANSDIKKILPPLGLEIVKKKG